MYTLQVPVHMTSDFLVELRRCAEKYGQVSVAHAKHYLGAQPAPSDIGLCWTLDDVVMAKIKRDAKMMEDMVLLPDPSRSEEFKAKRNDALDSMMYAADAIRNSIRQYSEHDINLVKEVFESLNKKGENTMVPIREKTEAEKAYEAKCLEAQKELEAAKAKEAEEKELARKRDYAKDLHDWYKAFADAGFSEDQAWMLVFEKVKGDG